MTQPKDLPHWATTADYPAGTDPFRATPRRVAPSSGAQDDGATPGEQLAAQRFNYLQGVTLEHLAAVVDAAAFNVGVPARFVDDATVTGGPWSFTGNGMTPTDHPILCEWSFGTTPGMGVVLLADNPGSEPFFTRDGILYFQSPFAPVATNVRDIGMASNVGSGRLAACIDTHNVLWTDDKGGSAWNASGTILDGDVQEYTAIKWTGATGGAALDKWLVAGANGKVHQVEPDFSASTLLGTASDATRDGRCFVVAPYGAPTDAQNHILHLLDANSATVNALEVSGSDYIYGTGITVSASSAAKITSGCYSLSHSAWFLSQTVSGVTHIKRSTDALGPYSDVGSIANGNNFLEMIAFGRSLVAVDGSTRLWVSSDGGVTWRYTINWDGYSNNDSETVAPGWVAIKAQRGRFALIRYRFDTTPQIAFSHYLPSEIP